MDRAQQVKRSLGRLRRRMVAAKNAFLTQPETGARAQPVAGVSARGTKPAMPGPKPRSPQGTRVSSKFFNDYPRFYETSKTTPYPWRLNLRYEAILAENADALQGARVLDIASHDGRWSLAALQTGAASVVGIEARADLVENAEQNMAHYGVAPSRYQFLCGDVFTVMAREQLEVDVVLCLGFLYHTLRWSELMHRIKSCQPQHLIIDTTSNPHAGPMVRIRTEHVEHQRNAVADAFSYGDVVLSGAPSVSALRVIARSHGFEPASLSDWGALLRDNPEADHVNDYRERRRVTMRCRAV